MGKVPSPSWGDICLPGGGDTDKSDGHGAGGHAADMFDLMEQGVGGSALTTLSMVCPDAPHTRCSVQRVKSDGGEILYHMYREGGEHLLTARSSGRKDGSMSFSQFKQDSQHCIAELCPGKRKGEYALWLNSDGVSDSSCARETRQPICSIAHDAIKDSPLYSMRVSLPDTQTSTSLGLVPSESSDSSSGDESRRATSPSSALSARTQAVRLRTKVPEWNEEMQSYTLDYNGRARLASAKNFQLEAVDEAATAEGSRRARVKGRRRKSRRAAALAGVKLQFGKYDDNTFNLDYSHPLCGMQALAIALTTSNWS